MFPRKIGLWLAAVFPAIASSLLVEVSQNFPKGLEIENMVLRPSGSVLAVSYASVPHIFEIPVIPNAKPEIIYTFQNATGISSIAESSTPDVYFVITGNFTFLNAAFLPTPGSYAIHRVSFDKHTDKPIVKKLASLDAIAQPNGMITIPNTPYVLIADCRAGFVFRFNTETLELTTYFDNPLLKPVGTFALFGVNGIKLSRGHFYFSNTNQQIVARVKVEGKEACLVGEPEIVATQTSADDFIVNDFNGDIYIAENGFNELGFVGKKSSSTIPKTILGAQNSTALLSPTAVIWAKGAEGRTLIVSSNGIILEFITGNFTTGGKLSFVHLG